MSQERSPEEKTEASLKPLYARSVVNSLSSGMVSPFTGAYAVKLGASSSLMGWFQSSSNISNNVMQVVWGRLSDRLRKRIPFIILGGLIVSVLWIPMIFVANATQLIMLLAVQALLGSMATPALTAIIGDLVPASRFGRANASIYLYSSIGGLIATLAAGMLMVTIGGTLQTMFFVPLIAAAVLGIVSCIPVLGIKEKKRTEKLDLKQHFLSDIFSVLKHARKTPDFLKYCYVAATFEFFMSIAWPLFSITQVTVLNASMLQLGLLSVVQSVVMIVFQHWAGKRADTTGRKPLLVLFRFSLITVPLAYALSPDINTLIAVGAFWGLANALGQVAMTAYLLDVTPEEYRGSFAAIFNLVMGVTTFFGSLVGGYLSDYLTSAFGLILALQIVYLISTVGRGIGAALHLTLKETLRR